MKEWMTQRIRGWANEGRKEWSKERKERKANWLPDIPMRIIRFWCFSHPRAFVRLSDVISVWGYIATRYSCLELLHGWSDDEDRRGSRENTIQGSVQALGLVAVLTGQFNVMRKVNARKALDHMTVRQETQVYHRKYHCGWHWIFIGFNYNLFTFRIAYSFVIAHRIDWSIPAPKLVAVTE